MRGLGLIALLIAVAPLGAQEPPLAEALRRQVMERFLESFRAQAGLTPDQDRRFREVTQRSFERRRELEQRERAFWRALEGQMRPGVAADADSVTRLLDGLLALGQEKLDQTKTDQREYAAFLTPIQRAQLTLMWERFQRQVEQVRQRQMQMRPGRVPPP
jgi:Spy/CpxP family protein refolding chaperone